MDTPTPTSHRPSTADLAASILDVAVRVPASSEPPAADPAARTRALTASAARKTSALSAAAALPPGPIGWLTLVPELAAIWRIQARLVADIAAVHGRSDGLTREVLLHCLFAHSIERPLGGFVVRAGERLLVRTASYRALQPVARSIAARLSRRTIGRGIARFVPVAGSVAVAAWAWRETAHVARNAAEVFSREIDVQAAEPVGSAKPAESAKPQAEAPTRAGGDRPTRSRPVRRAAAPRPRGGTRP
jgi:hypothetical protein